MKQLIDKHQQHLLRLQQSYYLTTPEALYSHEILRLTKLQDQLSYQFKIFDNTISQQLLHYQINLKQKIDQQIQNKNLHFQQLLSSIDALSPLKVMQRGYTLISKDQKMIKKASDLQSGDTIDIQFYDGYQKAQIK